MKEQRRSRRLIATVSLELDANGDLLLAAAPVINLNRALTLSAVNWPPGADLAIRNPGTGLEVRGRVVWSGTQDSSRSYEPRVEFHSASPAFWGESYNLRGEEAPRDPPSSFEVSQSPNVYLHGT
jgi:hypothetical protein